MDRQTARSYAGKHVIINEGKNGRYVGLLEQIETKPKKIWSGIVKISGILLYPEINIESDQLPSPLYSEGEKVFCTGNKISPLKQDFPHSYKESVNYALAGMWNEVDDQKENNESVLAMIHQELKRRKADHLLYRDVFVYYSLVKKARHYYVYDEEKQEALSLDGCPFEFEIKVKDKWKRAHNISGPTFELENGKQVDLSHGDRLRLNKSQFDPYRILINELDKPALHALERGLRKLGIFHENSVYCHNSLLIQLLSTVEEASFKGVNFISYSTEKHQYMVQHHYERDILEEEPDIAYDRFEFTSDTGERLITTYATQLSKD
ncbi:DUF2777 family protein [Bacillus sp. H-16]|uniref:DUF2777 family protein n=1 Tax=Alteribacter salitolerans TaxID=2912333 RepID=UPI001964AB29|nr:DUF2777 family protein [Alteribacter salitolerans]MBM7094588.1 DUF2777 family protein [Alteribacter salitolerans]